MSNRFLFLALTLCFLPWRLLAAEDFYKGKTPRPQFGQER